MGRRLVYGQTKRGGSNLIYEISSPPFLTPLYFPHSGHLRGGEACRSHWSGLRRAGCEGCETETPRALAGRRARAFSWLNVWGVKPSGGHDYGRPRRSDKTPPREAQSLRDLH